MSNAAPTCLLLVEDDALVRLTVAMMLEDHGFGVVEAATGEEALRLMEQGLDAPVMVTDVDLGAGVSGLELADRLRARRPDLVIVFITGRVASLRGRVAAHEVVDVGHVVDREERAALGGDVLGPGHVDVHGRESEPGLGSRDDDGVGEVHGHTPPPPGRSVQRGSAAGPGARVRCC